MCPTSSSWGMVVWVVVVESGGGSVEKDGGGVLLASGFHLFQDFSVMNTSIFKVHLHSQQPHVLNDFSYLAIFGKRVGVIEAFSLRL
jgi:hypothetical protein